MRRHEEEGFDLEEANGFVSARASTEELRKTDESRRSTAPSTASGSSSFIVDDESMAIPRWQRGSSSRVPYSMQEAWNSTKTWVKGPSPPKMYRITPVFANIQRIPLELLERYAPRARQKVMLLVAVYVLWFAHCSIILRRSSNASKSSEEYGKRVNLECTSRLWESAQSCSINGDLCRPFSDSQLAFRCPSGCQEEFFLSPYTVGDEQIAYEPVVIGGPSRQRVLQGIVANATYRGDSFVCASAIHAGLFRASTGGCGTLSLLGELPAFESSNRNGLYSTAFKSYFPQSFAFLATSSSSGGGCKDPRWSLLPISVFYTTLLSLFTTNPTTFFWSIFVILFFHVSFVSDPPSPFNYYDILSISFGRFLPAAFCAWVIYRYIAKRSLLDLEAQVEKTILWLGPAWVGALNNVTFDRLPLQRLTPNDLASQPGAIPTLLSIVLIILLIAISQAWSFRQEGRMPRYLVIYAIFTLSVLAMAVLPGESLRLHHYILALLLLPGTSFQNRSSLVYQGLLLGLFINGTARWGFASVLETPAALLQGAPRGSLLPPVSVMEAGVQNITFDLGHLPVREERTGIMYDGISILVNDVERSRRWHEEVDAFNSSLRWTWTRHEAHAEGEGADEIARSAGEEVHRDRFVEYFRFAFVSRGVSGDFTNAGVWQSNGTWTEPRADLLATTA